MKYRMIASDLDETLLDGNSQISDRNKKAVEAAIGQGIMFVIATGRMFKTSISYLDTLGITCDWPVINNHGALIKTARSEKVLFHQPLNNAIARSVIKEVSSDECHMSLYIDDILYVSEKNQFTQYYETIGNIQLEAVGDLNLFLEQHPYDPCKITIVQMDNKVEEIEKRLLDKFNSELSIRQSSQYFLEVTDKKATKGQALAWLADLYSIKAEEIMAIGDGPNDHDMICYAGLGVAVSNAHPLVLEAADVVAPSNIEDGVAVAIEKYAL